MNDFLRAIIQRAEATNQPDYEEVLSAKEWELLPEPYRNSKSKSIHFLYNNRAVQSGDMYEGRIYKDE